jgi:hypothetical protein
MSQIFYCDVCEERIERRSDHWRVSLQGEVHPHNNDFLPPRAADVCTGCLRVWVDAGAAGVVLDADFVRARRKLAARETITPSTTA